MLSHTIAKTFSYYTSIQEYMLNGIMIYSLFITITLVYIWWLNERDSERGESRDIEEVRIRYYFILVITIILFIYLIVGCYASVSEVGYTS